MCAELCVLRSSGYFGDDGAGGGSNQSGDSTLEVMRITMHHPPSCITHHHAAPMHIVCMVHSPYSLSPPTFTVISVVFRLQLSVICSDCILLRLCAEICLDRDSSIREAMEVTRCRWRLYPLEILLRFLFCNIFPFCFCSSCFYPLQVLCDADPGSPFIAPCRFPEDLYGLGRI